MWIRRGFDLKSLSSSKCVDLILKWLSLDENGSDFVDVRMDSFNFINELKLRNGVTHTFNIQRVFALRS